MATKTVTWCTSELLPCVGMQARGVIICLQSADLVVGGTVVDEIECGFLEALICGIFTNSTCPTVYTYTFSYDDEQLADPLRVILSADIVGAFCKDCMTDWVTCQLAPVCVADSITIDFSIDIDGCITGDVLVSANPGNALSIQADGLYSTGGSSLSLEVDGVPNVDQTLLNLISGINITLTDNGLGGVTIDATGGGGGNAWLLLGNAGTVDGVNFLGTTDNVAFDIRQNNERLVRIQPGDVVTTQSYIGGDATNSISTDSVYSFIGWGGPDPLYNNDPNTITNGYYSTIVGGAGNTINPDLNELIYPGGCSFIGGGQGNTINADLGYTAYYTAGGMFIGGGFDSTIQGNSGAFIGGGFNHFLEYNPAFSSVLDLFILADTIVGGNINFIFADPYSATGGFQTNTLGGNFIGGGETNEIDIGISCIIVGGQDNFINYIVDTNPPFDHIGPISYTSIIGGLTNESFGSHRSLIGGGGGHLVYGEDCSSIFSGYFNTIITTANIVPTIGYNFNSGPPQFSSGDSILSGFANVITEGFCSVILGGAFLTLGSTSIGYQSPTTRDFTGFSSDRTRNSDRTILPFATQVDTSAFSNIAYFGDVDIWVANTNSTATKIKFFEPNADLDFSSTNYSSFAAQAQAANIDYIWPASALVAGQVLTISTVVGTTATLIWAAGGGGGGGFWSQAAGTLFPTTSTDRVLIGGAVDDTTSLLQVLGDVVIDGKLTVTGPIDPTYIEFTQIVTPSNPAATKNRLYFKADEEVYKLDSAGNEVQLGGVLPNPITDGTDGIGGTTSVDWQNRLLVDTLGVTSIDWGDTTADLLLPVNTTIKSQIRFSPSATVNVAAPTNGDLWWNGTELFFFNGTTNIDLLAGGTGLVTSVSNADGSIISSPTTGAVDVSLNINHANAWTALQSFNAYPVGPGTFPTLGTQLVDKVYVDAAVVGQSARPASDAATTAALPAVTYANGAAGVGATLTENANGALPAQDGITLAVGQTLLVKDQAAALQNGIYTVTDTGSAGTPFILTRLPEYDQAAEITNGSFTAVVSGTVNGATIWIMTTTGAITVGTTALNFSFLSTAAVLPNPITDGPNGMGGVISVDWQNRLLADNAAVTSIDYQNRLIYSSAANIVIDYENYLLKDTNGFNSVAWDSYALTGSTNVITLLWDTGQLFDLSGDLSADWINRTLLDSTGLPSVDWAGRSLANSAGIDTLDWQNRSLNNATGTAVAVWGTTVEHFSLAANSTTVAQMRFAASAGVNVTSPTQGHLWYNGTNLFFFNGTSNIDLLVNQTITLTGDVTGSGTGTFAATIANDAVTFAKFQNITTNRLLGRATAGSGDMEEITLGTGLSFTGTTLNAVAGTGDVVGPASAVNNNVVFFDGITGKLIKDSGLTLSGSNTGDQTITLTGDVTGSGTGTFGATLATVNGNVGTFGSATESVVVTVNAKGLITAISNVTVTPAVGSITGLGTGVATFLATPSSANLATAVTDETGTGALVFATSPAFAGTPTSPTATAGTNTTQLATTAFVAAAVVAAVPNPTAMVAAYW